MAESEAHDAYVGRLERDAERLEARVEELRAHLEQCRRERREARRLLTAERKKTTNSWNALTRIVEEARYLEASQRGLPNALAGALRTIAALAAVNIPRLGSPEANEYARKLRDG